MGRRAKNGLIVRGLEVVPRPDAPFDMSEEHIVIWRSIVDALPADHFTSANLHLLVKLCKHIVTGRKLDALLDAHMTRDAIDVDELTKLQKMRQMETTCMVTLSRSMRLTQQSYGPNRQIRGASSSQAHLIEAPWDKDSTELEEADAG